MPVEKDAMIVSVEARINNIEKNMARASATSRRHFSRIQDDAKTTASRVNTAMAGVGNGLKTALAGFAGGFAAGGLMGTIDSIRGAFSDLANVAAEARRAGLGVEAFQELQYAAMLSKVSVDGLVDGMKELALRGDEYAVTGAGSGAEAFQRLGYSADEVTKKLQDPPKFLEEIIEKLRTLDKAAQIRLSDELFGGTGGEQFVRFLDQGVGAIAKAREEARQTGNVLSSDMIKKAEEVDKAFNQWSVTIGTNFKATLLGIIPLMQEVAAKAAQYQAGLGKTDMTGAEFQRTQRIKQLQGNLSRNPNTSAARSWRQELDELTELQRQAARMGRPSPVAAPAPAPAATTPSSGSGKGDLSNITKPGDSAKKILEGYAALEQAALARIESLRVEQNALGLTTAAAEKLRFEQDLLAEATRDGTVLTQAQKDRITELATQYGTLSASIEKTAEAQENANAAAEYFGGIALDSITDLALEGEKLEDVFNNVAKSLARAALQAAIMGQGPLAGILGTAGTNGAPGGLVGALFKALPKFHTGGVVPGMGEVPIMAKGGEVVLTPPQVKALAGPRGGGATMNVQVINNAGAQVSTRQVQGPQGPTLQVQIDDMVANALQNGTKTGAALKRWGGNRMRG